MTDDNHYQILEVSQSASQVEIKRAYRRLAKQFHPDSQSMHANHEKIIRINAAYEVLGDPQRRRTYDQQFIPNYSSVKRQQRTAYAQHHYQRYREAEQTSEANSDRWLHDIYLPINQLIYRIVNSLDAQIDDLSADPFDDELMEVFQEYLRECRDHLQQARQIFSSQPNPAKVAKVAAVIYYCLNQVGDGLDELEWFSHNYDDRYLHTGKELFRIAQQLRYEAEDIMQPWGR